jgi:YidC/Oxa1 family membrane protein insertase
VQVPLLVAENSLFKAIGDIFHPLFVVIADVLAWIYGIVPTYAVAILLLTVLIMAILTPLTIKSTRSMLAMQALQPEMQKLRAKYKGAENRQQLNEEMMKLYRERGVSPTGGCLPMFLQMPAFIVLYDVIRGLANTVKPGTKLGTGHRVCHPGPHQTACATPRYVPHHSAIYQNLIKTPGVMHSIGLNLAAKPLTHHAQWVDYIPYFALLAVAVGLQYFQMAQMTRRNKKNNAQQQMPQQMQTMQRVMPLIFAYIYFLVPAGVVIYMIVSSAIRVLTQDLIFRYGLVQPAGVHQIGSKAKAGVAAAVDAKSSPGAPAGAQERSAPTGNGGGRLLPFGARKQVVGAGEPTQNGGTSTKSPTTKSSATKSSGQQAAGRGRRAPAPQVPVAKPHPRSKSKRARKAR